MSNRSKIFIGLCAVLAWFAALIMQHLGVFTEAAANRIVEAAWTALVSLGLFHAATNGLGGGSGPGGNGGRIRLWMMGALAGTGLLLAACTTTTASMYSGLYTQAKAGVQVFDDNTLKTMRDMLCAQPYSSIQRHPEYQAGIVILCGPLANTASLNAEQLALLAGLYTQLGLRPTAAPLPQAVPK